VTIGVTYLSVELEMSGAMIGLNILTLLGCGVVGTKLSTCLTTAFGSCKRSLIAALVYFAFVSALAANILIGKESQMLSFPVAVLWGLAFGWVYPSQRVLYSMLLPGGQEVEYVEKGAAAATATTTPSGLRYCYGRHPQTCTATLTPLLHRYHSKPQLSHLLHLSLDTWGL